MDQAGIQQKINLGYGIATRFLGAPYQVYRPVNPLTPMDNPIDNLLADFDPDPNFSYRAPGKYASPIYYGLYDATNIMVGDYFVGAQGTWFVAGIEPNKPQLCVACNRTINITRPADPAAGSTYYGGDVRGDETPLLSGWGASLLQGTKGERLVTNLPGDTRAPWALVLLPHIAGGPTILAFDRLYDDIGGCWTVSSVELTNLGWRLTVSFTRT